MRLRFDRASQTLRRPRPIALVLALGVSFVACGCNRSPETSPSDDTGSSSFQGRPIVTLPSTNGSNATVPFVPADFSRADEVKDGVIQLRWDKLSGFKYDVYEVYSETNAGRALIRSDDTIPGPMKAYDGKVVSISGFILPLRTKKGLVTEFLLLRDQGTCCFGARAQINHFIRVRYPAGFEFGDPVPLTVSGVIRVSEIYIQGYLTGIYQLEAEKVSLSAK